MPTTISNVFMLVLKPHTKNYNGHKNKRQNAQKPTTIENKKRINYLAYTTIIKIAQDSGCVYHEFNGRKVNVMCTLLTFPLNLCLTTISRRIVHILRPSSAQCSHLPNQQVSGLVVDIV